MSSTSAIVRPFDPADAAGVQTLVITVQHEHGVKITLDDQPDLFEIPQFYQNGVGNFWVAVDANNKVVGTIAIVDIGNRAVALRKVFLSVEQRGSGLATKLLDTVYEWMRQYNYDTIYLGTISILQAAIRFYTKNGFEQVQKSSLPASFPLMAADNVYMKKTLNYQKL